MEQKTPNFYNSILKATGVFGGMQVLRLFISIITTKFIAVYLGPIGIGMVSLLNNAINIIVAATNFEFLKTATREVAIHHDANDKSKLSHTIATLQKTAILIGILGASVSVLLSKTLSKLAFGNYDKQNLFILLGLYFVLTSFSNVRLSILQGVNNIKALAWSSIVIAFFTSIGTIIIYYFLRFEGIIWAILYASFVLCFFSIYFTRKFSFGFGAINFADYFKNATPMLQLGFLMSLNLIFGQIVNFIVKIYISNNDTTSEILGLYEVSTVILVNYVGLIFNAMAFDFYPKLTSFSHDNQKMTKLVNNQIEVAIILITPAIIFLYLAGPFLIEILYTKSFIKAFEILEFALFSIIIKAVIFPLGYIVLVKGNKKLFFTQALLGDVLNLILSIVLYKYLNLNGLGLVYIVNYVIYGIYIYMMVKREYQFKFENICQILIGKNIMIGILAIAVIQFLAGSVAHILLTIILLLSCYFSYMELSKRIDIKSIFLKIRNKK